MSKPNKISKEDAQRLLEALKNDEQKLQEKLKRKKCQVKELKQDACVCISLINLLNIYVNSGLYKRLIEKDIR